MQILGFQDYLDQGRRLAQAARVPFEKVMVHHFPDGESKVTMPVKLEERIVICRSLDYPNSKLMELFLACRHARERGVKHITLVSPYLCYMRQDKAFHEGEVVSQKVIGEWLGELVDKVVTVDPHLHRIQSLDEVIPHTENIVLSAAPLMAEFLTNRPAPSLLLGPDVESGQWVSQIAEMANMDWAVATKIRHSDHRVQVNLPDMDFKGRNVIIIDDVASTGHTIANTAKQLKLAGAGIVKCMVTHPLFAVEAEQVISNACVNHVWSTDSINHHSNVIHLDRLISEVIF